MVALAVLGAVTGLIQAINIVRGRTIGIGMADPPLAIRDLPQIIAADPGVGNTMTVLDLPVLVRLACALPSVLVAALTVTSALLLAGVLHSIARGHSFRAGTRLELARLSLTLILGGLLCGLAGLVAFVVLTVHFARADDGPWDTFGIHGPSVPIFLIALGVVAAAVDYAFKDGARLEKEAVGVV